MEIKIKIKLFYNKHPFKECQVVNYLKENKKLKGKLLLDAGCGAGLDFFKFIEKGANVYGIDQSEKSIDFIKSQIRELGLENSGRAIVGDIEKTNFKDNMFDYIYCRGVLHHTPSPEKALFEFKRILKRRGEVELIFYNKYSIEHIHRKVIFNILKIIPCLEFIIPRKTKKTYEFWDKYSHPYWKAYSFSKVRSLCENSGLKVIKIKGKGSCIGYLIEPIIPQFVLFLLNKILTPYFGWHIYVKCSKE